MFRLALASLVFIVTTTSRVVAAPGAVAPLVASPMPVGTCGGSSVGEISFEEAFATPIVSPRVLRFISYLTRAPEPAQRSIVDVVRQQVPIAKRSETERGCHTPAAIATTRALYLMAYRWTTQIGNKTDPLFVSTERAIERAVETLADKADATDQAALVPFAYDPATAEPATLEPSGAPCAVERRDAKTVEAAEALYPSTAKLKRTTGSTAIDVRLDAHGLVENATLQRSSITGVEASALVKSSLLAAVAATYEPARSACANVPGTYVFRVIFTSQ